MIIFSIIIPTYNRAQLICPAINSVLAQTYSHFEVIIVDDGGTDNTKQLIETNYTGEKRIRYFHKPNEERGAARNFGLKQAEGEYAVFFDSDDLMKPHYLKTLNSIIQNNTGIAMLATQYNFFDESGKEYPSPMKQLKEGWYDRTFFLKGNMLACNYCINIKNNYILFPKDKELASMEDWLFLLSNMERNKIFISKEICLSMRQHDDRTMNNNQKVIRARRLATEWVLQNLSLTVSEQKSLKAWSYYFCGVHQYLDNNRSASVKETFKAIKSGGLNKKFFLLMAKSIIGRKLIKMVK